MAEPACLRRSFSHPSNASREAKEGDPIRALTESISFGRFMSESLAWEKWSTFSHNRYLEEVEQFSKPGSVAQKKAYFEAHYKQRAAMKAAALLEQVNTAASNVPEVETLDASDSNPSVELESAKASSDAVINEQHDKVIADAEHIHSIKVIESYPDDQMDMLRNEVERGEAVTKQNIDVENPLQAEKSKQFENTEGCEKNRPAPVEKIPNKEAAEKDISTLTSNKRQINISSKSASQGRASKLPKPSAKQASSAKPKSGTHVAQNNKKSVGDLIDKRKSTPKSLHMSISFPGKAIKSYLRMSKDSSPVAQNPTKKSVIGAPKLPPSVVQETEFRRTKPLFNQSVSGGILQALSKDHSKSSTPGSKVRSSIISSPFSFRSEERAAKRKEFFQKLEEKNNAKESEKLLLKERSKEKAENGLTKLQQTTGFRSKPSEDSRNKSISPRSHVKKIPPTRPRSPKLGRKAAACVVQETNFRVPHKASVNAESSKCVVPRRNQSITRSVSLLPKKKAHENAPPNIQL